jgi:hypothetical protein
MKFEHREGKNLFTVELPDRTHPNIVQMLLEQTTSFGLRPREVAFGGGLQPQDLAALQLAEDAMQRATTQLRGMLRDLRGLVFAPDGSGDAAAVETAMQLLRPLLLGELPRKRDPRPRAAVGKSKPRPAVGLNLPVRLRKRTKGS